MIYWFRLTLFVLPALFLGVEGYAGGDEHGVFIDSHASMDADNDKFLSLQGLQSHVLLRKMSCGGSASGARLTVHEAESLLRLQHHGSRTPQESESRIADQ